MTKGKIHVNNRNLSPVVKKVTAACEKVTRICFLATLDFMHSGGGTRELRFCMAEAKCTSDCAKTNSHSFHSPLRY